MKVVEGIADVDDVDDFLDQLADVAATHDCTVQAFDARYVVGRDHLERAVDLADRAIERDENVARDRSVEILLYVAGRRQIDRALEIGVSQGEIPVVVVVDASDEDHSDGDRVRRERQATASVAELLTPADTLGEYDPERVAEFYDVTDAELEAVDGDLAAVVLERVALLDVEK